MTIKLIGDTVSLSAGASDTITLTPDVDVRVKAILWNSTGRCKVTRIEFPVGVHELLKGSIELDQLNKSTHIFELPEEVPIKGGVDVIFHLTDISGATNDVYIALLCIY